VHVVGHSIGCHLILHALEVVGHAVGNAELLMPFLYLNDRDRKQRLIHRLIRWPLLKGGVAALAAVVGRMPMWVQRGVLRGPAKGMSENGSRELYPTMVRFGGVLNNLVLGMHEFARFRRRAEEDARHGGDGSALLDWEGLRAHGDAGRMGLSYAEDDHWAPLWQAQDIRERTGLGHKLVAGVSHDFVVKLDESILVADHIVDACTLYSKTEALSR